MGRGTLDFGAKEVHPTEESLEIIIAEEARYLELVGTSVIRAVQFAREGCFLVIYPRRLSFPGKSLTKWVWLDSERMSLVWETDEGVLYRVHLRDVRSIATGCKSKFLRRKLSPDIRPCAFEITTNKLGPHLRRHYRMVCHDQRECSLWLVALSTTIVKAAKFAPPTLRVRKNSGALDGYKKAGTLLESNKSQHIWGKLSRPHTYINQHTVEDWLKIFWVTELRKELATSRDAMRLLQELGIRADMDYVSKLFAREDTDGSGIISLSQFRQIFHELTAYRFICDRFSPSETGNSLNRESSLDAGLSMKSVKQWLLDQQFETAVTADVLISDLIDCNKSYLATDTSVSYLGLFVLLKSNDSLNIGLMEAALCQRDLPLSDYWIRASARPFDSVTGSAQSELAISLRKTIDMGYRCFALYLEKSANGKPLVKSQESVEEELSLSSALNVIKGCAFVASNFPIIIVLDFNHEDFNDSVFGAVVASQIEYELGPLLVPSFSNSSRTTLADLAGKVIISYCAESNINFFGNRQMNLAHCSDRWLYPPRPFSSIDMTETHHHLAGIAAIRWANKDSPYQLINRLQLDDFVKSRQQRADYLRDRGSIDTEDEDQDQPSLVSAIQSINRRGGFIDTGDSNDHLLCVVQPPELLGKAPVRDNNIALYLNHCNIIWEAPLFPSIGASAIFPKNAAFVPMHKNVQRACLLKFELLAGHMLPLPSTATGENMGSLKPSVTVKLYNGRGLLLRERAIGTAGASPYFKLNFTVNLEDEYTSIIVFEVSAHGEGSMPCLASRAQRVIWLRSGLRWVSLKDSMGRAIPWSGLWIRTQKQTKDVQSNDQHSGRAMRRLIGRTILTTPFKMSDHGD